MNWKDYEKEIHDYFYQMYPNANVTYDARLEGRYSKKQRQIDVLIEDEIAGFSTRVVVDAKYFSENIDVKCVESFISMLEDVGATHGLLVTQKGYSQAAINRAYYGPHNLELDVFNFDELLDSQGLEAIPYSGKSALLLSAPFGWVVDSSKQRGMIASLYQRGISLSEAEKRQEWSYLNYWHKDNTVSNVHELVELQNLLMQQKYKELTICEHRSPNRIDGLETHIRIAQIMDLDCIEITGYIDCGEFIAFFVLFTKEELQSRNVRKIAHLLKYSMPINLKFDNSSVIKQLKTEIPTMTDSTKLASAYNQLAKWYAEMDELEQTMKYRRLCWDSSPEYYENITPLITGELKLENFKDAQLCSIVFFSLAPENPQVMQDLLAIYKNERHWKYLEEVVSELLQKYKDGTEASGNICFHYAEHLNMSNKQSLAYEYYKRARDSFIKANKHPQVVDYITGLIEQKA